MAKLKVEDGNVRYMLKTFDGTYVTGSMSEAEARLKSDGAEEDGSIVGYELVKDNYRFETETVEIKMKPKKGLRDEL